MPDRRDPPPTEEGWYALHDFRRIDWDAWRDAPESTRDRALSEAVEYLDERLAVTDAEAGDSALYSVLGHEADLLVLHLRPTTAHLDALGRGLERTAFGAFTDRADSFVSVTEASGYSEPAREYLDGDDEPSEPANHIQTRLYPSIPTATHVSFYPMDRRRDPEHNWYDLPFEQRAAHMDAHRDIGRAYGGRVVQMITSAIAIDDWEWGITLWGEDLTEMKNLLYEMRFDPSTSRYAEFGPFYVGRRFPPADLPALLAGDPVPTDGPNGATTDRQMAGDTAQSKDDTGTGGSTDTTGDSGGGPAGTADTAPDPNVADDIETVTDDAMPTRLGTMGIHEGEAYDPGAYGLVVYSTEDASALAEEVAALRGTFEQYDTHVMTSVRATRGEAAVVSIWETEPAAGTAEGLLTGLSGVSRSVSGPL